MAQIENVSGTAFVVAEFRAEENREKNPLYRDPWSACSSTSTPGRRPIGSQPGALR